MKIRNGILTAILASFFALASVCNSHAQTRLNPNQLPITVTGSANVVVPSSSTPVFTPPALPVGGFQVTDYFFVLTQNVTSSSMGGTPKAGDEAVITIQQNSSGGWAFVWPANFLNAPAILTGPNQATAASFQYCGAAGINAACPAGMWQATDISPNSPGAGPCSGPSCINVAQFGAVADEREYADATWTGGQTTITISGTDQPFTSADNNKACFAVPQAGGQPTAIGTFTFTNATTGTCAPSTAVAGSGAGNGIFNLGTNDTTAWVNASAACYALQNGCTIVPPAGRSFLSQCTSTTKTLAINFAITVMGHGYAPTTIVLLPTFNFSATASTVNGIQIGGTANGCFWNSGNSGSFLNFQINGENQTLSGISTSPVNTLITFTPGWLGQNFQAINWATGASNSPMGFNMTGAAAYCQACAIQSWGNQTWQMAGNGNQISLMGSVFPGTLQIETAPSYDFAGTHGNLFIDQPGSEFIGVDTIIFGPGSLDIGTTAIFDNAIIDKNNSGNASTPGWNYNNFRSGSPATTIARNTNFNGPATGGCVGNSLPGQGIFIDEGGNVCNGGPFNFSGTYVDESGNNVIGVCPGTLTANATLGFYGTGPNAVTPCTTTIGSGKIMSKAGTPLQPSTVLALIVTAGTGGVNGSDGVVTVIKNGSAQSMTCTLGTSTLCNTGANTFSYSPGDLISAKIVTQIGTTLANVRIAIVIW